MNSTEPVLVDLGTRLAEVLIKNTAATISTKIRALKAAKDDKETINSLEEIIQELISDKNDVIQIAQAYEQELMSRKINDVELSYITNSLIPTLRNFASANHAQNNSDIEGMIDVLSPLVSKETLTILQLLGFNFKKAIGEPLTLLVQKIILSKLPEDSEIQKLKLEQETEIIRTAAKNPKILELLKKL